MIRLHALAATLAVAALPALAQTPAPAAPAPNAPAAGPAAAPAASAGGATATAATQAALKGCGAKPEHPGRLASDNMKRAWQRDATTYLECLKKAATDQQQIAQEYVKAANAIVDEYNATVRQFQADAQKAAQD